MEHNSSASSPAEPTPKRPRGLVPPTRLWIVLVLCAAGILVNLGLDPLGDGAHANVVTWIMTFIGLITVAVWFFFLSGYGLWVRRLWLTVVLMVGALGVSIFRIERLSGDLVPKLVPRWAPSPDRLLKIPAEEPVRVDLSSTTPDDFPQFLGPHRIQRVDHIRLTPDWSAHPPRLVWRRDIGAGWSGFAAVGGFAVTLEQRGDVELVTCYEIESGKLAWSSGIQARHRTICGGTGPRSTPTIVAGKVFAMGATGQLCCLDGVDGQVVWSRDLLEDFDTTPEEEASNVTWGRSGSPLVIDQLVVVPAGGPTGGRRWSLVAYDVETGREVWRGGDRQVSYASPALARLAGHDQILIVNENNVSSHNIQTGEVLWEHPWEGRSNFDASTSQAVPVDDQHVFLSKAYGQGSKLLKVTRDADQQWKVDILWHQKKLMKTKLTNVAIRDGFVYGLSDGILECIDLMKGRRKWRWRRGRFGHGQILLVDEMLLVQSDGGELALVEATPEAYRELSRIQAITDGQTWNHLCLYGPYLLVRSDVEAACYKLALDVIPGEP